MRGLLHQKRIIVLCGSGGVGKTTLSAALALMGAMEGKRSLVLTVDPARRLAQAMGLKKLDDRVRPISSAVFARAGLHPAGSLSAVMLDTRRAFDRIIDQMAPSPAVSARILSNPIYDHMAGYMSGSHEYMAMEKLLELHQSGEYDLLVLDTPPTRHALDFLEAPKRLLGFMEDSVFRWFIKPSLAISRFPLKILKKGAEFHLGILERFTGFHVLGELSEFFSNFSDMQKGFRERAIRVRNLLKSPSTAFVLVALPNSAGLWENLHFCQRILEEGLPLSSVAFNCVRMIDQHSDCKDDPCAEELGHLLEERGVHELLNSADLQELLGKLRENFRHYRHMAELDAAAIQSLRDRLPAHLYTIRVPFMGENVHNLRSLHRLGEYLVADGAHGTESPSRKPSLFS